MPQRIHRRRVKGWTMPEGAVFVGRPTRWGNPFRAHLGTVFGPDWFELKERRLTRGIFPSGDDRAYSSHSDPRHAVEAAVDTFRTRLEVLERDKGEEYAAWLAPLRGHDLACYCPLGMPCHADLLLIAANRGDR